MHKQRLQILIDPEQRRGLDAEAERLGISVGAVIRGAIDAQFGGGDRRRRLQAVAEMEQAAAGRAAPLELIEQVLDEERVTGQGIPQRH